MTIVTRIPARSAGNAYHGCMKPAGTLMLFAAALGAQTA
jgi:hypothetical protein